MELEEGHRVAVRGEGHCGGGEEGSDQGGGGEEGARGGKAGRNVFLSCTCEASDLRKRK